MLLKDGVPTQEDLQNIYPSVERLAQGPVSVIECFQQIPCNPCVEACNRGAIYIKGDINGLPLLAEERCNGCALCISRCPGLAIFVVDQTYSQEYGLVMLPYEYVPVPEKGQLVTGFNRAGDLLGQFEVIRVISGGKKNMTWVITLAVPQELLMEVRSIGRGGLNNA